MSVDFPLFFSLTTKWLELFLYHKQKPSEFDHPSRGFGLHTVLSLFGEAASLWSNSLYLTFCLARFPDVTKPKTSGAWHSVLPALPCCHDWANSQLAFCNKLLFIPNIVELQQQTDTKELDLHLFHKPFPPLLINPNVTVQ